MNLTIVLGTLLAFELVGDITYKIFYRMVSRNKYKVGDIVWVKNNGSLEPAEITCITWKCFCRSESIAKPKYDIMFRTVCLDVQNTKTTVGDSLSVPLKLVSYT